MDLPLTTGQAAQLLGITEPRLAEVVRRGHVSPEPPILAGRRLWHREHIEQAAQHLGCLTDDLRAALAADWQAPSAQMPRRSQPHVVVEG